MVLSADSNKNVISDKTKIDKPKIRKKIGFRSGKRSLEDWLNTTSKDSFSRPIQSTKCKQNCGLILKNFYPKKMIRIGAYSDYIGVDIDAYRKLCDLDKTVVHRWFFDDVWSDNPQKKIPISIFELQIAENCYKNLTSNAELLLDKMCREHRYKILDVTKEEIESQKTYFENNKRVWEATLKELRELIEENTLQSKGGRIE